MNGHIARLINRATRDAAPGLRRALKREWQATPSNARSAGKIRHAIRQMARAADTLKVEDYAPVAG